MKIIDRLTVEANLKNEMRNNMINVTWRTGWVFIYKNHKLVKAMPTTWRDPFTMAQAIKRQLGL